MANENDGLGCIECGVGRWLVFNVGCIECGVDSNVVGTYTTFEEAERVAATLRRTLYWRDGGQNHFEVFDLHSPPASEYADAVYHVHGEEG